MTARLIPFEKNEYNYYAAELIFGDRSPVMKHFSAFKLGIFRKKTIVTHENQCLDIEGKMRIQRQLPLDDNRVFSTGHTDMRTAINQILTYTDSRFGFNISDSIFSDDEYEYFTHDWNAFVQNKIRTMGMLMKSIHDENITDIPLLVNEYPEITRAILERSRFWKVR